MKMETCLANPTNVLVPRLLIKAQVFVQAKADVVAVQTVGELLQVKEVLLKRTRNSRLRP